MTIIYTSHYMEEVEQLCTRIGIIDHGRLVACDTLAGLLHRLPGIIRIRLARAVPEFQERLAALPGVRLTADDGLGIHVESTDVKPVLMQLMALMSEMHVEVTGLEIKEPNLERVFLHLTGRACGIERPALK